MCGSACAAGGVLNGMCVLTCAMGQTNCAGSCRDTQRDESHCMCGNACAAGEVCSAENACVTSPARGAGRCVGACRRPTQSDRACGACGLPSAPAAGLRRGDVRDLLPRRPD
ncbi:MAG: hypothetical protein R3A48_23790 [Polyangiales bacterium]